MRDTTVCVCLFVCNCSTITMRRKLTASNYVLLDFDSWISKLKLLSRVMASLTQIEGCCSLFKIFRSIICSQVFIQLMSYPCTKALAFY